MGECICSGCANLKSILAEDSEEVQYTCVYGFPSEACDTCEAGECSETCEHFSPEPEEDQPRTVKCKGCGKELQKVFNENTEGDVFCINCYLETNK